MCVTGSDGRVPSKFDLHENASRNEVVDGAINLSPLAMPELEVYEYYLKLLVWRVILTFFQKTNSAGQMLVVL
jgi:hypothetical protein